MMIVSIFGSIKKKRSVNTHFYEYLLLYHNILSIILHPNIVCNIFFYFLFYLTASSSQVSTLQSSSSPSLAAVPSSITKESSTVLYSTPPSTQIPNDQSVLLPSPSRARDKTVNIVPTVPLTQTPSYQSTQSTKFPSVETSSLLPSSHLHKAIASAPTSSVGEDHYVRYCVMLLLYLFS